jgi:hypothetical protein
MKVVLSHEAIRFAVKNKKTPVLFHTGVFLE